MKNVQQEIVVVCVQKKKTRKKVREKERKEEERKVQKKYKKKEVLYFLLSIFDDKQYLPCGQKVMEDDEEKMMYLGDELYRKRREEIQSFKQSLCCVLRRIIDCWACDIQ